MLYLKLVPKKGRGVFSDTPLEKNTCIEMAPVIVVPQEDMRTLEDTILSRYHFNWGRGEGAIALGFGSLYNHSSNNNAEFIVVPSERLIIINAITDIAADEEICINYRMNIPPDWEV